MAPSANSSGGVVPLLTTSIAGFKFYILVLIFLAIVVTIILITVFCIRITVLCIRRNRTSKKSKMRRVKHSSSTIPLVSKEIVEVIKIEHVDGDESSRMKNQVECEIEESSSVSVESPPPSANIGWGRWYSLKELENVTDGFAEGNVIGGGYGIVYRGILQDGSIVAVRIFSTISEDWFFAL
jgi:hypothetical protein